MWLAEIAFDDEPLQSRYPFYLAFFRLSGSPPEFCIAGARAPNTPSGASKSCALPRVLCAACPAPYAERALGKLAELPRYSPTSAFASLYLIHAVVPSPPAFAMASPWLLVRPDPKRYERFGRPLSLCSAQRDDFTLVVPSTIAST